MAEKKKAARKLPKRDRDWYVAQVLREYKRSVQSIIRQGKLLERMKDDLEHGEFEACFRSPDNPGAEIPYSVQYARRLMEIARVELLRSPDLEEILPSSVRALHALSKVPEEQIADAIDQNQLAADMTESDVRRVFNPPAPKPKTRPVETRPGKPTVADQVQAWLDTAFELKTRLKGLGLTSERIQEVRNHLDHACMLVEQSSLEREEIPAKAESKKGPKSKVIEGEFEVVA